MPLFTDAQREQADIVSALAYCNPFRTDRIDLEKRLLGAGFQDIDRVWNLRPDMPGDNPNVMALGEVTQTLLDEVHRRLQTGNASPTAGEAMLYDDLLGYCLFHSYREQFGSLLETTSSKPQKVEFYQPFLEDAQRYLQPLASKTPSRQDPTHLFAVLFQIRRAFHHIYTCIIGGSLAVAGLRARVWESIFTHDLRRYRRCLYDRLGDMPTLVTGETGTGKELVAQAVGLSRYIPFNADAQTFGANFSTCFRALNLSALSPTLIESELFGHRRGAFTGALDDKIGWLEACGPLDTVFLDEIGDLDPGIQVKLLRVLQTRTFQRLGDTVDRHFQGKIVAATHRNLAERMANGSFRSDLYYRLCADQIETVPLRELMRGTPDQLAVFVQFIAKRLVGKQEAERLATEVTGWIETNLGTGYPWPGNVRELEQCVRNIMIHNNYHPAPTATGQGEHLLAALTSGDLTADELLRWYCSVSYARTGSYQATARELELDRRTVKSKIDPDLLERYPPA